jgi:hypothetical protein
MKALSIQIFAVHEISNCEFVTSRTAGPPIGYVDSCNRFQRELHSGRHVETPADSEYRSLIVPRWRGYLPDSR